MEILAAQAWLQQAVQVRLPGCSVACGTPEHLGQCGKRGRGNVGDGGDRAVLPSGFSHKAAHSDHEGVFIYG